VATVGLASYSILPEKPAKSPYSGYPIPQASEATSDSFSIPAPPIQDSGIQPAADAKMRPSLSGSGFAAQTEDRLYTQGQLASLVLSIGDKLRASGLLAAAREDSLDPAWKPLLERLCSDGFDENALHALFARLGPNSYSPAYMAAKITELYGVAGIGIRREGVPSPVPPQDFLRPVEDATVGSCLEFMKEQEVALALAEKRHGVPASVILAVLLIETRLGLDLGNDTALRALASMAATSNLEMLSSEGNSRQQSRLGAGSLRNTLRQKSNWAYGELTSLIRYAQSTGYDPSTIPCSIYGAIGLCQFMPSNIGLFAVDGDEDGKIDLFSLPDAISSVANYLEANGWRGAKSDRQKLDVIYTYNHDYGYASAVLATSKRLELAQKGKVSLPSIALVGGSGRHNPYARLDPSLRRGRAVPRHAMVRSLGNYLEVLQ
jgi:membrane-bound lytic murein transglycosylase B